MVETVFPFAHRKKKKENRRKEDGKGIVGASPVEKANCRREPHYTIWQLRQNYTRKLLFLLGDSEAPYRNDLSGSTQLR
ncbi:MAG: hypothetical protein GY820_27960 [Gammaproteobacteria bacterium]|nr:hypothetical protein [Gammaproteobacteria bacterium]